MQRARWSGTGVVLAPLVAVGLRRDQIEACFRRQPDFAWALYDEITARFLCAIENWKTVPRRKPVTDLAGYVVGALDVLGQGRRRRAELRINQAQLGRATGLRRETVNRVLKSLVRAGTLRVEPQRLYEIDLAAMRRLCPPGPGAADLPAAGDERPLEAER